VVWSETIPRDIAPVRKLIENRRSECSNNPGPMVKFVGGLLIGMILGAIFSDYIFPDGPGIAVQHWVHGIMSR
jgi:hypothetical protein